MDNNDIFSDLFPSNQFDFTDDADVSFSSRAIGKNNEMFTSEPPLLGNFDEFDLGFDPLPSSSQISAANESTPVQKSSKNSDLLAAKRKILNKAFSEDPNPSKLKRQRLSKLLNLETAVISRWFQRKLHQNEYKSPSVQKSRTLLHNSSNSPDNNDQNAAEIVAIPRPFLSRVRQKNGAEPADNMSQHSGSLTSRTNRKSPLKSSPLGCLQNQQTRNLDATKKPGVFYDWMMKSPVKRNQRMIGVAKRRKISNTKFTKSGATKPPAFQAALDAVINGKEGQTSNQRKRGRNPSHNLLAIMMASNEDNHIFSSPGPLNPLFARGGQDPENNQLHDNFLHNFVSEPPALHDYNFSDIFSVPDANLDSHIRRAKADPQCNTRIRNEEKGDFIPKIPDQQHHHIRRSKDQTPYETAEKSETDEFVSMIPAQNTRSNKNRRIAPALSIFDTPTKHRNTKSTAEHEDDLMSAWDDLL